MTTIKETREILTEDAPGLADDYMKEIIDAFKKKSRPFFRFV